MDAAPLFMHLDQAQRGFAMVVRAAGLRARTLAGADGCPLTVYETGEPGRPAVLLVAPLGISCVMLANLMQRLAASFHVLTWEGRELGQAAPDTPAHWAPAAHGADMVAVLAGCGVAQPRHIVSYCSGAYAAVHAVASELVSCRSLCLVSPPIDVGAAGRRTRYEETFLPLLDRIAVEGVRFAAIVRAMLGEPGEAAGADPELAQVNNLPFASASTTHRYARLHAPWRRVDWKPLLRQLALPVLVVHGVLDDYIHPDTVQALAGIVPGCRSALIADAGHFGIHDSPALIAAVLDFVENG